mmetsp:Transcript_72477/g.207931  ORF Transcript_72477/g.207931 Transcript_72477/m.207931 type:complete len:229 (+) Transcript_72477:66-752(+)
MYRRHGITSLSSSNSSLLRLALPSVQMSVIQRIIATRVEAKILHGARGLVFGYIVRRLPFGRDEREVPAGCSGDPHRGETGVAGEVLEKRLRGVGVVIQVWLGGSDQGEEQWIGTQLGIGRSREVHLGDPQLPSWLENSQCLRAHLARSFGRQLVHHHGEAHSGGASIGKSSACRIAYRKLDTLIGPNLSDPRAICSRGFLQQLPADGDKIRRHVDTDNARGIRKICC